MLTLPNCTFLYTEHRRTCCRSSMFGASGRRSSLKARVSLMQNLPNMTLGSPRSPACENNMRARSPRRSRSLSPAPPHSQYENTLAEKEQA